MTSLILPSASDWKPIIEPLLNTPSSQLLIQKVEHAYATSTVYPAAENIFKAFDLCSFSNTKVILLGQDPYHGEGQAQGLSFSVPSNTKLPPSLKNIFKEISSEFNIQPPSNGDLTRWAAQGVLMLNTTLTVEAAKPASHSKIGWDNFTTKVIQRLSDTKSHLVFILWGNHAIQKTKYIDPSKHLILTGVHPSPLSAHRGFFGCNHFIDCNTYLASHNLTPINWG